MITIENKWCKKNNCPDSNASLSSNSLGLESFWGLFTIAVAAAMFALIISLANFFKEHRNIWSNQSSSVWSRIRTLFRIYDQRNLSSHTFRKSEQRDQSSLGTLSNSPCLQSPSSYWNNSERGFSKFEGQSTPSSENIDPNSSGIETPEGTAKC